MKKVLKVLLGLLAIALVIFGGAILYVTQALPNVPVPEDLTVEVTPERVARGEYLANHVCVCMDCHSVRDWNTFAAPPTPGTLGAGGDKFDRTMQFPGEFVARNITPFALKDWSDGEIYRAITSGVSKDGHPFFPIMPYPNFNKMDTEDIYSIIAYLRTLDPIEAKHGPSEADFPVSVIMHMIPEEPHPTPRPDPSDAKAYGAYMANAAGCVECHTETVQGEKVGKPMAGGFTFNMPNGAVLRSPNITMHESGLGGWTRAMFIQRFKQYADSNYVAPKVDWAKAEFQTIMPWSMYAGMTEQDLGAIYDYLKTVQPVANQVVTWTPPGS